MQKVIFATGNAGKMKEIRMILADVDVEVLSLKEAGIVLRAEENGSTFAENALIKARDCAEQTGYLVLADDSGLEIDYLNKDDVLVLNNTKVLQNRLYGVKEDTGAKIEVFLLKELESDVYECLIKEMIFYCLFLLLQSQYIFLYIVHYNQLLMGL